jgi:hypothetical protein
MITTVNKKRTRMFTMQQVMPKGSEDVDSVATAKRECGGKRAFDILMKAQYYWSQMDSFRKERERNKNYTYGRQWDDMIKVNGKVMSEAEYIRSQGNVPLKNNLIRRLVRNVIGVYRNQSKEPTCTARDRDEQKLGETMSTILQCNMQLNRMNEVYARTMEEFLISAFIVHRKSYGWRNGKEDCWTDYVQPNNFFIDNNMRDFRGWDVSMLGEVHDVTFGQLCEQFAESPKDYERLKQIYSSASRGDVIASYAEQFGHSRLSSYDFLLTSDPSLCRVIEVWSKEQKRRYRVHDYLNGDIFKIDPEDYDEMVAQVNAERLSKGQMAGMAPEEIPLLEATWFIDDYWYFRYLSPFGDVLKEGETPYEHGSHPYVFKAYPFIDGEIHSFVADVIDQQRYTNRLITLYDWVIRATAKGVLLVPKDCIPDGVSPETFCEQWSEVNGVIIYEPSESGKVPTQVSANSVNIGIGDLLNMQLKFFEDISGVNGALQGKPGYSGMSASLYNQQTQNSTTSLLDILEAFSYFVKDAAYKDVKNMQQFYDDKRVFNIAGKNAQIIYDPQKIRDVEFDLSIVESTSTPSYRAAANDVLMQLFNSKAISIEQLLEHGDFPFADDLLQSIKSQKEQLEQGQTPDGISPQLQQQVAAQSNPRAMQMLSQYAGAPQQAA